MLRCRVAAEFIYAGQYEAAREALGELWPGIGGKPEVREWPPAVAAEVLLRCGALTALLGGAQGVEGAQEQAKDLLTEAIRKFQSQGRHREASEAQGELGACYWRLGAYDEARVIMGEALKALTDADVELKAKIHIRRTLVELSENRYHEALNILKDAEPVFESANDALKGKWHGQRGLVLARLADREGNAEYVDRAIIEFTAAIYHYEQAKHERYCATNLNNLAMLLYRVGRHGDAHEHLDRAGAALVRLNDAALLAQVDETRARVLIAEGRYGEADRVISRAVQALGEGGESALLADALAVQGVVRARLGSYEDSVEALRRAVDMAEGVGAFTNAGLAALAIIEEHGADRRLSQDEVYETYMRADLLLEGTQDAEDVARLRACARVVMRRLAGVQIHDQDFSFYGAVHGLEAKLIEQALEESGGSVVRAAKLLGLKHQTFTSMLQTRHQQLLGKRMPRKPRRRSIIRQPK
ncbi:MAG TPA: helix-turn-helix domain-containing protein [Pyrinomonadaceae bacterium]|nr:helix-turn-helix domain-containing protein [Pyrinomonadaceae bacterium]